MSLEDQFKYLVGGYYGVRSMDEFNLKVYVLKEIEDYIKNFIKINHIDNYDYKYMAESYEKELSLITKLQDSLIVLNKINGPIELIIMIKRKIKRLKEESIY